MLKTKTRGKDNKTRGTRLFKLKVRLFKPKVRKYARKQRIIVKFARLKQEIKFFIRITRLLPTRFQPTS